MPTRTPSTMLVQMTTEQLGTLIRDAVADALGDRESTTSIVYLTPQGLAEALQISAPTLRTMIGEGMPHVVLGDHRRFRLEDVHEWLAARSARKPA